MEACPAPDIHRHDGINGNAGIAQPAHNQAVSANQPQEVVQQAKIGVENPQPQNAAHHIREGNRHISDGAEKALAMGDFHHHHRQHQTQQIFGNGCDNRIEERVFQRRPVLFIVQDVDIVFHPNKGHWRKAVPAVKAKLDTLHKRIYRKKGEQKHCWKHHQI